MFRYSGHQRDLGFKESDLSRLGVFLRIFRIAIISLFLNDTRTIEVSPCLTGGLTNRPRHQGSIREPV